MAKKKINEPIVGFGKQPDTQLTVQKSIPLLSLWQSDMSLVELKILDTYLSRINSHEPEKRTVIFTKGELEQLLGVKKINKPQLAARLKSLGRFIDIEDGNTKKIHQIALFEEAYGEMDENGIWTVKLTCTSKAMKYIFNVEKLGYLRYKLHSIVSLKSRYAYVLFLYLEHNRFRKSWEVDVDVLRKFFNCTEELYDEFKYFNQRILRRCQKELEEKTDCKFTYEPVKKGRKVVAVKFTLKTIKETISIEDENQLSFDDLNVSSASPFALYHEVLETVGVKLTDEQIAVLVDLSKLHVEYNPFGAVPYEMNVAEYIKLKCRLMKAQIKPVKNEFAWLKKACEEDW